MYRGEVAENRDSELKGFIRYIVVFKAKTVSSKCETMAHINSKKSKREVKHKNSMIEIYGMCHGLVSSHQKNKSFYGELQ